MIIRQRLYRRRFPRALGPLIPSFRSLVSAAEVAHLLELPSARMKGVPVRRVTIPRIPAPPEVGRGRRARTQLHTPADRSANGHALGPAPRLAPKGELPHMSDDHSTDRDRTPEIPRLPAPPAVMRGLRPRRIPPTDTSPSAAPAHDRLAAGSARPRRPNGRGHVEETSVKNRTDIEDRLYPMLRADNAEVVDLSVGPQVRGAAGRRPGHGEDERAALLLPQRPRRCRCRTDRDRPQVRALAHLPARSPRATAASASGSSTSATRRSGCRRCG